MREGMAWNVSWIPASAGMTEMAEWDAAGIWGVCNMGMMNQAPTPLRLSRATHWGVQRGFAPLRSYLPPRLGGLKERYEAASLRRLLYAKDLRCFTSGGLAALFCLSHIVLMGFLYR